MGRSTMRVDGKEVNLTPGMVATVDWGAAGDRIHPLAAPALP